MNSVGRTNEQVRDAWVRRALADVPAGGRVLDAGAGQQPFRDACNHLDYVAQDAANNRPREHPFGLQIRGWQYGQLDIVSDITSIPEPSASFDVVLCTEVLEHVPAPLGALREFARLLRPDGQLIVTAPFQSLTHFAPHHYHTGFNRYFYEKHLPDLGFVIEELTANGNYFDVVAQELRRLKSAGREYARLNPRLWERWATRIVLGLLARYSQRGARSIELGCFGLMVRATRLPSSAVKAAEDVQVAPHHHGLG